MDEFGSPISYLASAFASLSAKVLAPTAVVLLHAMLLACLRSPLYLKGDDIALHLAELHPDQVDGAVEVAVLVGVSLVFNLRQRLAL